MASIMTVLGPITPQDLGFTSMHEHRCRWIRIDRVEIQIGHILYGYRITGIRD